MSSEPIVDEPKEVLTKDKRTIMVLTFLDHVPMSIEPVASATSDRRIMLYRYGSSAHTHYEAWNKGSREPPFDFLRKYFECEDMFKSNLHRFAHQT